LGGMVKDRTEKGPKIGADAGAVGHSEGDVIEEGGQGRGVFQIYRGGETESRGEERVSG
jgi:hypothetical protein